MIVRSLLLLAVLSPAPACATPQGGVLDAPVEAAGAPEAPARVPADAQRVLVTWHADGDTLHVRASGAGPLPRGVDLPVRLLEVDAPERPRACFADEARAALTSLLPAGGRAFVAPDEEPVDRYGRHLRYVWNADGVFVNEAMVRGGFATAMLVAPNDAHIERMRHVEAFARAAGRGLWGACDRPAS